MTYSAVDELKVTERLVFNLAALLVRLHHANSMCSLDSSLSPRQRSTIVQRHSTVDNIKGPLIILFIPCRLQSFPRASNQPDLILRLNLSSDTLLHSLPTYQPQHLGFLSSFTICAFLMGFWSDRVFRSGRNLILHIFSKHLWRLVFGQPPIKRKASCLFVYFCTGVYLSFSYLLGVCLEFSQARYQSGPD